MDLMCSILSVHNGGGGTTQREGGGWAADLEIYPRMSGFEGDTGTKENEKKGKKNNHE